jgi:hypothetical protein
VRTRGSRRLRRHSAGRRRRRPVARRRPRSRARAVRGTAEAGAPRKAGEVVEARRGPRRSSRRYARVPRALSSIPGTPLEPGPVSGLRRPERRRDAQRTAEDARSCRSRSPTALRVSSFQFAGRTPGCATRTMRATLAPRRRRSGRGRPRSRGDRARPRDGAGRRRPRRRVMVGLSRSISARATPAGLRRHGIPPRYRPPADGQSERAAATSAAGRSGGNWRVWGNAEWPRRPSARPSTCPGEEEANVDFEVPALSHRLIRGSVVDPLGAPVRARRGGC